MPVTSEVDHENQVTIFEVTGVATFEEGLETNKTFYDGDPTKNVIWDFSKADLSDITNDQFRSIVDSIKNLTGKREGGKTARTADIITPTDGIGLKKKHKLGLIQGNNNIKIKYNIHLTCRS